jgi:hypothetical protein
MIPFLPGSRRRHADSDGHVRARTLLAERMDAELADSDAAWLSSHLLACADCVAAETAYAEQRDLLRGLADPVPPRDLWARTSARIELESSSSRGGSPRRSVVPLGALSGLLVVAVVVGASLLSQPTVTPAASASPPALASTVAVSPEPRATPIAVGAGEVGWALQNDDGSYSIAYANVDQVCGNDIAPDCAPLDPPATSTLRLTAVPRSIVRSPTQDQLVVVEADTRAGGGALYVMPVPTPAGSPIPTLAPSPSAVPPTPSPTAASTPPASEAPSNEPSPSVSPSAATSPSPVPTADTSADPSPSPGGDAVGGADEPIAIASDVIVMGAPATYSSDGAWFAFSARPSDGTAGPDIYVWQPGHGTAHAITTDHRSVFSAWVGDRILGSRAVQPASPVPAAAPSDAPSASMPVGPAGASPVPETSTSFLLDPASGESTTLADAGMWRPVVDPTGRFVVYWNGTIVTDASGVDWKAGDGRLVLARLDPPLVAAVGPTPPAPTPSPEPEETASPDPGATGPAPSAVQVVTPLAMLSDGVVPEWDVHWDETGTRFALWLGDPMDLDLGALSLHEVDPLTGALDPGGIPLADVPALVGFSIGDGRLVWATPPGQGGEGSRIVVFAWRGSAAGRIESAPDKGAAAVVVIK